MDKNDARPPSYKKGSGAGGYTSGAEGLEPACGVLDLPFDVLVGILHRVSKAQSLGGPLHFALVCQRFADARFRSAVLSLREEAGVPGPLLADQLQAYQGPTSLKLDGRSVQGLRALWRALAVQGPVLTGLHVDFQVDTCVGCEGECPDSHGGRDSQLCARHGESSACWAFSGPFLKAHPGLRSLNIQGDHHRTRQSQGKCLKCCVGFTGPDSLVSLDHLRSSLSRLKRLSLQDVNLGWPKDWPSVLPSLKSLDLSHWECISHIGHQGPACTFPWSVLEMTGLTSLSLTVGMLSIFNQDFGRLTKLKRLSLALYSPINAQDPTPPLGLTPPASIWTLTGLRSLTLRHMENIPESGLGRLVGLTDLVLTGASLRTLPNSLQALEFVEFENIAGLEGFEESFGRHEALTVLSLDDVYDVRRLAADLCQLPSLMCLFLKDLSNLEVLPVNLGRLQSLRKLMLMGCGKLRRLPADFSLLASLTELRLHSLGSLEELPDGFGRLQSLRVLEIGSCQMLRRFPADFGQLSSLTDLKLEDLEALEEFPDMSISFGQLRKLELAGTASLHLSGVPAIVVDNREEDMSPPTEVLPGSGGCLCLRSLSIKNCGSLVAYLEFLQRLLSTEGLDLVNASGPGESGGEFLKRIPHVDIEGHAGRGEGRGWSENAAEDLGEEGEDGE